MKELCIHRERHLVTERERKDGSRSAPDGSAVRLNTAIDSYLIREVLPSLEGHRDSPLHPPAEAVVLRQPERCVSPRDGSAVRLELRHDLGRELFRHERTYILLRSLDMGRQRAMVETRRK